MSQKAEYLVIHNAATPAGKDFTGHDIERWHCFPRDLPDGRVRYKGGNYNSREDLPDEEIHGQSIRYGKGNGWTTPGYSIVIRIDGTADVLVENNFDQYIDQNEITNGVRGFNAKAIHICLIGGLSKDGKEPFMYLTQAQHESLESFVSLYLKNNPEGKVVGHCDLDPTGKPNCPGFDVAQWVEDRCINH